MVKFRVGLIALLVLPLAVLAGGFSNTYSLASGSVSISNTQANSSWFPISVLVLYDAPSTGTATVQRVSQSYTHTLAACSFTNVTSIVWVPDRDYSFNYGDALAVQSSATNGVVQVMRKGD